MMRTDIAASGRDVARTVVDFRQIDSGAAAIGFARAGMAITLNRIARGDITDAIADMLRNEGFESAVVDLGEYRTIGRPPAAYPRTKAILTRLDGTSMTFTAKGPATHES